MSKLNNTINERLNRKSDIFNSKLIFKMFPNKEIIKLKIFKDFIFHEKNRSKIPKLKNINYREK